MQMPQNHEITERISRLDYLRWYDVSELTSQGVLYPGCAYKKHILHRNGSVFGASVAHFLKGLYGMPFDERDKIDPILLAKHLGTQYVFNYLKNHPELQTTVVFKGCVIPAVFIGNLKYLQEIIESTPNVNHQEENTNIETEYHPNLTIIDIPLD